MSEDTIVTRTKIIKPRCPAAVLKRQRLLDLLYDLLEYRLIIIAAPPGYGKTTLLIDMASHIDMPVCWYSLDTLDQDPQRFMAHFIASITQCFPNFGKQSLAALQSDASTGLDWDRLVRALVNEANEHIRDHFVIVLDDYHLVGNSEPINHFISRFVQNMEENCHLILASRTLLSLPDLALMVARSQVGGLELKDLAFRADEIQAFLLQNYHLTVPAAEAEKLAQETEGWITSLMLSAQTIWQGMADRVRLARVSGVDLYDYLAQQVLDQQPAPVRDFMLRTSLLEEFDAELCRAVLGPDEDWQRLMDTLLYNNLFVLPVENEGTWLRYHHLFRDFLQARLAQECPGEYNRILRRLAIVHAEREKWEKAYDIYHRLGDVEATADLIERAGVLLAKSGRLATLAEWIDALPPEMLTSHPDLFSLSGMVAVIQGDVESGLSLQNRAVSAFRAASDSFHLARALVRRATAHRFRADYQASLADADEAMTLAEGDEGLPDVQAGAMRARGVSLNMMGQLKEATLWLERSLMAYTQLDDKQNVALLLMELGVTCEKAGRYEQALTHYNRALDYWDKTGDIFRQANLFNNLGVLYHRKGDYEQARSLLERAIERARQSGYARIEALALCSIGDLYADLDAPEAALDAYRQAREIAQRIDYRLLLLYLSLAQAALTRSQGELTQAYILLESAEKLAQMSGSGFEWGLCQLEAGQLTLAEGNVAEAVSHLEEATGCFDAGGQRMEGARAHLYLAVARHTMQDRKAALAHLGYAIHIASDLESQHVLIVAGRQAKALLEITPDNSAMGRQASLLLRQVVQFEQQIPALRRSLRRQASTVSFVPPKLTLQALGQIRVTVNGRLVTGTDWQAQVARDLLFCLLAHPAGLTKEEVGVIFWPESSPAQLKLQFKQTVYRLRRALGQDVVLLDQDRYCFNRALDYEYDVDAFLEKMALARTESNPSRRTAAYQAAIALYTGPYLPGVDGTWAYAERERLQQAYVEAALIIAESCLETKHYKAAVDYGQRVLSQDPCQEEAHRLVMRAYAAMGNRANVARQLERCQQALKELNVPLSPQTETLYQKLMHR